MEAIPEKPDVTVELTLVTPEVAEQLLNLNTNNRAISDTVVAMYARDMAEGEWMYPGGLIIIGPDGELLDGQHRLHAVILSGKAQWFIISWGAGQWDRIDLVKVRKFNDALSRLGVPNAAKVAAITRVAEIWDSGKFRAAGSGHTVQGAHRRKTSVAELERFYFDHADRITAASRGVEGLRKVFKKGAAPSTLGLAYYVLDDLDHEYNVAFWAHLRTGAGLSATDPILLLRNVLFKWEGQRDIVPQAVALAYIFKAWNLWVSGREVSKIAYRPGLDAFPMPEMPGYLEEAADDTNG